MNDAPISVQPFLPNTSKKRRVHHSFPSPQGSKSLVQLKHFGNRELGQSQECGESSSREQKNCQGSIYSSGFRTIYFITNFFFFFWIGRNTVSYRAVQKGLWSPTPLERVPVVPLLMWQCQAINGKLGFMIPQIGARM